MGLKNTCGFSKHYALCCKCTKEIYNLYMCCIKVFVVYEDDHLYKTTYGQLLKLGANYDKKVERIASNRFEKNKKLFSFFQICAPHGMITGEYFCCRL